MTDNDILNKYLHGEGKQVMTSIAQKYFDDGIQKGIVRTAINMLRAGSDLAFIKQVTGLSEDEILKLKNKTQINT